MFLFISARMTLSPLVIWIVWILYILCGPHVKELFPWTEL